MTFLVFRMILYLNKIHGTQGSRRECDEKPHCESRSYYFSALTLLCLIVGESLCKF